MRIYIYVIFLVVGLKIGTAQQTPVFADYHYNTLIINPAYAGFHQTSEVIISGRTYLNQIDGSPTTANFTYHGPVNSKKVGIGGMITHDNIGVTSKTGIYGAYAYKLILDYSDYQSDWYYSPKALSFGITGGVSFYKEDLLSLNITDDPNFQNNVSETVPSVGVGVFYNSRHFYIGFSAPNLLDSSVSSSNNINITSNYYLNSGYRFYTSRYFFIEPSALLKYTKGAPLQLDMNLVSNYHNKFIMGIGYRTASTLNLLAGFYLTDNWRIIYNFSPSLNNSPLNQTHGLVLSYRFGKGFFNQ